VTLVDRYGNPIASGYGDLREAIAQRDASLELLSERLAELELAMDDDGWLPLDGWTAVEFSRDGLDRLIRLARLSYLKNPLINHAVSIQAHYVFGQGVNVRGKRDLVNDAIQTFWDDRGNRKSLTRQQALTMKEVELQVAGNVALSLFPSRVSGRVKIRTVPIEEIREVIRNPDDAQEPWFYKRVWRERRLNNGVFQEPVQRTAYYPDWGFRPRRMPGTLDGNPIHWGSPIYHVKVGGFDSWAFGVPEVYSALDWARAVKEDLEDYLTIRKALARFVWRLKTPGGAAGVAAAKDRLGTTVGSGSYLETNPPPLAGSTFIGAQEQRDPVTGRTIAGVDMEPIRTAGATPSLNEGRRVGLMVAAGTGIPETMLFGDADVGNLATAKTLDRPTELQMMNRQALWRDVFNDLADFVIDSSVRSTRGVLKGSIVRDQETEEEIVTLAADDTNEDPELRGEPMDRQVDIDFPALLERDIGARIDAIVTAATLDGKSKARTIDDKNLVKMLLTALGEDDVDEMVETIMSVAEEQETEQATRASEDRTQAEATERLAEAVHDLREAVRPVFPNAA